MSEVGERTKRIREEVGEKATLVAVSKTKPVELILESYDAGQRHFGENRPQEMRSKWEEMPEDIRWHMIGHLQTNKVKMIIDFVHLIHSVDSLKLLQEINKRAGMIERKVDVLLQVHIAEEEHKFGFSSEQIHDFFGRTEWQDYPHVRIRGLMGMATFTSDREQLKREFTGLCTTFESTKEMAHNKILGYNCLSMGMSGDYGLAIDCGSTMVRVGSKIFGSR